MRLTAPGITQGGLSPWPRALGLFGLYLGALIAVALPGFESMARTWGTASYGHGAAAAPVALFLIWLRRERLRSLQPAFWPAAAVAVIGAAMLFAAGRALDAQILQHVAIVGALVSGAAMIFGRRIAGAIAFPLGFLVFMVPFGESAVPFLRTATAQASAALLSLAEPQVSLDDFIITTSAGRFHVAEACAGLRMALSTLMVSSLLANFTLSRWRDRVALFALGIALALTANILRVVIVITVTIIRAGDASLAADHDVLGLLLYAGVFATLAIAASRLGRRRAAP